MFGSRCVQALILVMGLSISGFGYETDWICGYRLFPPQLKDGVYPHHYRPDRTVDFEHLKLEIQVFMKEMRIEGTAHFTFRPIHNRVKSVRFDAHKMKIKNVICIGQPSLDWNYSENSLYVNLPHELPVDQLQEIVIEYIGDKLKAGGRFGGGMMFTDSKHVAPESADQMYTLDEPFGASAWFPCGDYPNDRLVTEIFAKVPNEFATLSNGLLVDSKEDGEWRTDHWLQKIPHATYLVSLVVGHFEAVRDTWRGIPVEYYVEKGLAKDARPSMGKTPDMIEFFSNYLDYPYPYEKYAQIAVRYFNAGGMEHTTATTMLEGIVMDENARQDTDMEGLIMHELSHQWFGDLVTCESWPQLWLNESFATLSDALWDEHTKGKDAYLEAMLERMENYIGESYSYKRPIVSNLFEKADEMFDGHSYPKGAFVLHMLRQQLGNDLFRKIFQVYLKKNAPGLVTTNDFQKTVEETTGRPMDRFFEQWIFRPGHPKLQVQHEWLEKEKQVKLTLKQTQEMKEGDPAFAFPLTVEVCTETEPIRKTFDISKKEESVFVDCPQAPKSVAVDPDIQVLMELEHKKSDDMLLYDLEKGSTIIVRIRAARALADVRNEQTREALLKTAKNDSSLRVRFEAIATLGKDRSPETMNALLSLIGDPEPKVRSRVVNALGGFYKEKKVIGALFERFKTDSSHNVRADAARVVAQLEPDGAYEVLKPGLTVESWENRVQTAVMNALVDLKEPRVYDDLVRFSKDPYPRDVRTTAIRGIGRLAGKTKKNQNKTLDLLLEYLKSSAESIRQAAISGLQGLESEDAIPQLRWVEQNDEEKGVREAAERAITEIRKGKDREWASQNAGRIDKLEDQNKKLEERIKELETKIKEVSDPKEKEDPKTNGKEPKSGS